MRLTHCQRLYSFDPKKSTDDTVTKLLTESIGDYGGGLVSSAEKNRSTILSKREGASEDRVEYGHLD